MYDIIQTVFSALSKTQSAPEFLLVLCAFLVVFGIMAAFVMLLGGPIFTVAGAIFGFSWGILDRFRSPDKSPTCQDLHKLQQAHPLH